MFNLICKSLHHFRVYPNYSNRLFSHSFSSSAPISVSDSSNQHSFTVSYLINSCGLSPEKASSVSRYMNFKTPKRADSVLAFLQNHGFTKTQVSNLVKKCPRILLYDPAKSILPKLNFFTSVGLSSTDLVKIINASPRILTVGLENQIIPSFNFFRKSLQSADKAITSIKRHPCLLTYNPQVSAVYNIQHLREVGVPESNIISSLTSQPRVILCDTDNFKRIVEEVKEMGFNPLRGNFLTAIKALAQMSKSTWQGKVELYEKWGLSEDEIFVAFGKHPSCMMASKDKITRIMDFLVNKLGWETSVISNNPAIISMSLEKRIVPRCLVCRYLVDKGLMKKEEGKWWLNCTEIKFLDKIKKSYEKEAPELLKLYQEKLDLAK